MSYKSPFEILFNEPEEPCHLCKVVGIICACVGIFVVGFMLGHSFH